MALLEVRDLSVVFARKGEPPVTAVDGISFDVAPGQTVGLVGESGCGKSVTSLAIMGLLPSRGAEVAGAVGGSRVSGLGCRARVPRWVPSAGAVLSDPHAPRPQTRDPRPDTRFVRPRTYLGGIRRRHREVQLCRR